MEPVHSGVPKTRTSKEIPREKDVRHGRSGRGLSRDESGGASLGNNWRDIFHLKGRQ